MADTSELLHTIVEATNILFNLEQESGPGSKLNARERATIKDVRLRLDSLKSRLQAEAQAPAPVLTEKERVSYMQVKKCPLNKVEEALIAIIDRLTQPTPAS